MKRPHILLKSRFLHTLVVLAALVQPFAPINQKQCSIITSSTISNLGSLERELIESSKLLKLTIKHHFWLIDASSWTGVARTTYRWSQGPTKASGLFFGSLVSFDTISDPQKGSQSIVIWPYKSKLLLKTNMVNLVTQTNVGKNWDFNQMFSRFTLPPSSFSFNQ